MRKQIIPLLLLILALLPMLLIPTYATEEPVRTNMQEAYHAIANYARSLGLPEDSEIIQTCSKLWWEEQQKLNILAKVIEKEAGACPWLHRIAVGQVVMNRVASDLFPNTVFDVVNQSSTWYDADGVKHTIYQYSPTYCYGFEGVSRQSYEDAKFVLDGNALEWYVPGDIIWQAEFPQGKEVWWKSVVDTGWFRSTTYFCR